MYLSSTDENGRFQVGIGGDALVVDQRTGEINLPTGAVSSKLESDIAPTLGADLTLITTRLLVTAVVAQATL